MKREPVQRLLSQIKVMQSFCTGKLYSGMQFHPRGDACEDMYKVATVMVLKRPLYSNLDRNHRLGQ